MRWRIVGGVVLACVLAAAGLTWLIASTPGDRARTLRLPGVVEIQEVRLASKQGGRVKEVLVSEGDLVEEGKPLVVFEAPELEARREQQEAQLANTLAELQRARNGPRRQEIDAAAAAAAAAAARWNRLNKGYRDEEKREAKSDLDAADADYKLAEEELGRADHLFRQRKISQSEFDQYHATHDRARGRAASARARFELVNRGYRPEEVDEAAAQLEQARANLKLLQAGTRPEEIAMLEAKAQEMRARIKELDAQLAESIVKAPSLAVVDVLSVRKGDVVTASQTIVRILRAQDLWVKVYIPETDLGRVRLNDEVAVAIDAYPSRRFKGTVRHILAQSEFTPRNVQSIDERRHQVFGIKVRVDDPQGIFKSGMAAEVFIRLQ